MRISTLTAACRRRFSSLLIPLVLAVVTALIWCVQNERLAPANWHYPTSYSGDTMEILVRFKAVADGELVPFLPQKISRLGAPLGADWSAYPVSDKLLFLIYGNIARVLGVYPTSNLAVMLAFVTAALAFYGCARFLRIRVEWSFGGALLFAFACHTVMRGLPHLWLAYTYTVPCALLTVWLVGSARTLRWPSPPFIFCLVTSGVIGISNPYNLFFFLQLLVLAVAAQWLGRRRRENLWLGLCCLAVAVGSFAVLQCDNWIYVNDEGAPSLIARNYGGTEIYGLKLVELFVPPANHHWELFASLAHRYLRWTVIRGEAFYPYLGIIGVAGLVWIFIELFKAVAGRQSRRMPAHGLQIGWILLFSSVGGINSLFSLLFGLHLFRATNRFSIFISAIICFFVASRLSRLSRGWPRMLGVACALGLTVLGLYDQLPRSVSADATAALRNAVDADRSFGAELEAKLPHGSMLFQLPVVDFPETRPPGQLSDYEHFRLYLATDTQRMSYGTLKFRSPAQWQHDYEELEPAAMVKALEEAGFAAVSIDRRGYEDRGAALVAALTAAGKPLLAEQASGDIVVIRLSPAARPCQPLASRLTLGRGWNPVKPNEPINWSNGPAVFSFFNPYPQPISASLHFMVSGITPERFTLTLNGALKTNVLIDEAGTEISLERLLLKPGINRIDLSVSGDTVRISEERWGLRAFGIKDLAFQIQPESVPTP